MEEGFGVEETIEKVFVYQMLGDAAFRSTNATAEVSWPCHDMEDGFRFVSLPSSVMQSG
jgi:hypothetical protein